MNGRVSSLAVDSVGTVYVGGSFTVAGAVPANYIAKWNGSSWSALGSGVLSTFSPSVNALALGDGTLYAGVSSQRQAERQPQTLLSGTALPGLLWARA